MANKTIINTLPPDPSRRIIGGSNQRSAHRLRLQGGSGWQYNHHPVDNKQSRNPLYWQSRAPRFDAPLSSSGENLYTRQAVQRERLRELDLNKTVAFTFDLERPIGSSNQAFNKKPRIRDVAFGTFEQELDIVTTTVPNVKKRISFKATKDGIGYNGEQLTPFGLFSSSVNSGYRADVVTQGLTNVDFTNFHTDSVLSYGKETPMQGPFTEKYVGGIQARHNAPLMTSGRKEEFSITIDPGYAISTITISIGSGYNKSNYQNKSLTLSLGGVNFSTDFDDTADMSESNESTTGVADAANVTDVATALKQTLNAAITVQKLPIFVEPFSSGAVIFVSSRVAGTSSNGVTYGGSLIASIFGSATAFAGGKPPEGTVSSISGDNPRGQYLRDSGAKAPLNIKNIKTLFTSNSVRVVGNYQNNYEVIQGNDRADANLDFVYNPVNYAYSAPTAFLTTPAMLALGRSGSADYPAPRQISGRRISESIIAGTFAAPGSKQDSKQLFRDVLTNQFSPNNALPFRNIIARRPFNEDLAAYVTRGGYLSNRPGIPATIKTPRNSTQRVQILGTHPTATFHTGTVSDNAFVTRPIPAGDGYVRF